MTAAELRAILADAPDDANVFVVLDVIEGTTDAVTDGEVIAANSWGGFNDGRTFVQLQTASGADSARR